MATINGVRIDIEKIAKDLARHYRLRTGQPKKLPLAEIEGLRDELKDIWKRSFPRTPYESDFMMQTGYRPTALTEGFIERRDGVVDIVLKGCAEGDRPVRIVFSLPYEGDPTLTSKLQDFPVDGSDNGATWEVSWPITCET